MENKSSVMWITVIMGIFLFLGIALLWKTPQTFAVEENRYLAQKPAFSVADVLDGSYQEKLTDYASDQLPFRNSLMKLSVNCKYLLHPAEVNQVSIEKDGNLVAQVWESDLSFKSYTRNLEIVNQMATQNGRAASLLLVPTKSWQNQAYMYDSDPYYQASSALDIRTELEQLSQPYFDTDHHWTVEAAYVGAGAYLRQKGIQIQGLEKYGLEMVSNQFYGTTYSKVAGLAVCKPDEIKLPAKLPENLTVETCGHSDSVDKSNTAEAGENQKQEIQTQEQSNVFNTSTVNKDLQTLAEAGIYKLEKLSEKDKYAVYFGGNYPRVDINNPDPAVKGKQLIIIKDSFANSMVPYLTPYYEKIIMIDLRYYNDAFQECLKEYPEAELLVLYEMTDFVKEQNLYKLLQ